MGAQISKNGAKDETVAEKPAEAANKSNGQENGHAKTNGNAEAATEDVQANGKHSADGEVKAEEGKAEEGGAEKAAPEGEAESSAVANGEDTAKTDENGSASVSSEPAKTKKRFSFKKPFKLSGFSFKKSSKKDAEGGEAAAAVENGEQKKDAEPESEEAKPEASSEENKTEAPADEPKAEEPAENKEEKPSSELAEEKPAEEKQAEAAPQEPAAAESSDAPAAATE
ncbi:myristoylated alanine-rich C-kinase substrate-like [Sinocyclocheilus rhinocerous]|nr:PREDICTED: myristoylated alanine-rich C-kinase substrate-like [Sinocyclocheilus rhinocerous]